MSITRHTETNRGKKRPQATHRESFGVKSFASIPSFRPPNFKEWMSLESREAMTPPTNPFRGAVSDDVILEWLGQFEPEEQDIIERLLASFRFYGFDTINSHLRQLHTQILTVTGVPATSIWYVPVGYVAKSGSVIAYFYKTQNDIPQERFILASDLATVRATNSTAIVFLDDYIGSGHQARQVWDAILSINPRIADKCPIVFGALMGTRAGIEHLSRTTGFKVCVVDHITEADLPLSASSRVFPAEPDRSRARAILEKYGARLYPQAPLGYENSQGLLGFIYSTPNNTLPIFWSTEGGWKPLLPHKESYRDPAFLFGPPAGLPREAQILSPAKPLVESAKLAEYDISPEIASKIFTEFRRTDIFLVLAPVVRRLGLGETTFSRLLRLIGELKNLVHEREGVSSSVMMVPDDCSLDALGKLVVSAAVETDLASVDEILSMIQLVPATEGALIVRASGAVLGGTLFRATGETSYPLLPPRYHKAARASLDARGLLFFFSGDGRAAVFYQGNRILVYRGASWHLQPSDIEGGIRTLAEDYAIDPAALNHVFQLSLRLSDESHGALLTIGDHANVLAIAEPPKTQHIHWAEMHVGSTENEAILGLMRQDGATIISADGTVVQGMTFLRPPVNAPGVVELGRGSKHSTASKISGATRCLAFAVSVDGQVSVFGNGDVLFKVMG
jgi:hypothetical protein